MFNLPEWNRALAPTSVHPVDLRPDLSQAGDLADCRHTPCLSGYVLFDFMCFLLGSDFAPAQYRLSFGDVHRSVSRTQQHHKSEHCGPPAEPQVTWDPPTVRTCEWGCVPDPPEGLLQGTFQAPAHGLSS
jgi:hypothetical protein